MEPKPEGYVYSEVMPQDGAVIKRATLQGANAQKLPNGTPLYSAPFAVDDAMVERALASKYEGGDWIYAALSNCGLDLDEKRSVVRAALIAALQPGKE